MRETLPSFGLCPDKSCFEYTFSGANFREADLTDANLSAANLEGADFWGAEIRRADLTKLKVEKTLGMTKEEVGGSGKISIFDR